MQGKSSARSLKPMIKLGPHPVPPQPGSYALVFKILINRHLTVGKLGAADFKRGFYVYFGSARGSGGLVARIRRHLQDKQRLHWHIDYLTQAAPVHEFWYTLDPESREHAWARLCRGRPGWETAFRRFGASDCDCPAHLFRAVKKKDVDDLYKALRADAENREQRIQRRPAVDFA